ncbi:MAG TPA: thiamine phosphate synthase, partial [Gemmatimonadales bacterium]|nr:thiamine phosphate synthase [Gemmatimonadales bacterium]
MRPLPRLHAVSDASIRALPDLGARAAAIAAAGSGVALHARDHAATASELAGFAERLVALARPSEASVFVNRRADVAGAIGAHGVQLTASDPAPV